MRMITRSFLKGVQRESSHANVVHLSPLDMFLRPSTAVHFSFPLSVLLWVVGTDISNKKQTSEHGEGLRQTLSGE